MSFKGQNYWALILGGSSGFGLAAAKELASRGMNICVLHRDRRGAMARVEQEFDSIRAAGVQFKAFNIDALSPDGRATVLGELPEVLAGGKVRLLLHSIAFGSLKLIGPRLDVGICPTSGLSEKLGLSAQAIQSAADELFAAGGVAYHSLATQPTYNDELLLDQEELLSTVHAMGASLLTWTQELFRKRLFASDSRVIGLTSEGNEVAWLGYAAVSAAKAVLESVSRSIAKEYGPHGIRSNIIQPGVTDTPALRLIPGGQHLLARAEQRNPLGRTTQTEDVARVVAFLASEDASWINGSILRVDGGEHISGS